MEEITKENSLEEEKIVSQKIRKRARKLPKAVRPEEFKSLISTIPTYRDKISKPCFLLAYGSGLRISEVLRCKKEHFKEKSLFIPESKYGVERYVPIPKGWKEEFFKELPINITSRTLERKFRKYSKLAKLDNKYTFHSLRHGFATRCLESGIPINQVQMLLGHSNVSTTSIYVKANPIDAINNYWEKF